MTLPRHPTRIRGRALDRGQLLWVPVPQWPEPKFDPPLHADSRQIPRHRRHGGPVPGRRNMPASRAGGEAWFSGDLSEPSGLSPSLASLLSPRSWSAEYLAPSPALQAPSTWFLATPCIWRTRALCTQGMGHECLMLMLSAHPWRSLPEGEHLPGRLQDLGGHPHH